MCKKLGVLSFPFSSRTKAFLYFLDQSHWRKSIFVSSAFFLSPLIHFKITPTLSTPSPQNTPRLIENPHSSIAQEFSTLPAASKIYKLVGPVLLAQERSEATMAVDGRLEFIDKEM